VTTAVVQTAVIYLGPANIGERLAVLP